MPNIECGPCYSHIVTYMSSSTWIIKKRYICACSVFFHTYLFSSFFIFLCFLLYVVFFSFYQSLSVCSNPPISLSLPILFAWFFSFKTPFLKWSWIYHPFMLPLPLLTLFLSFFHFIISRSFFYSLFYPSLIFYYLSFPWFLILLLFFSSVIRYTPKTIWSRIINDNNN